VRRNLEWADGHVAGATHIPLHDLPGRLAGIPSGEVWVHCQSGYRSMTAASLLATADRQVISVNDHFSNAASAGVPLESG
jgi:hydroxyacylglutathione hydrolase